MHSLAVKGSCMSDIHFSNYRLEKGIDYFMYIGELKNYWLNTCPREALSHVGSKRFLFRKQS